MNYELAKQLKTAGFPGDWKEWDEHDKNLLKLDWNTYGNGYSPTLSELIEACGDDFDSLEKYDNEWKAFVFTDEYRHEGEIYRQGSGSTPEEAVAKLWLSVNKK